MKRAGAGFVVPRVVHPTSADVAQRDRETLEAKRWDYCIHDAGVPVRILKLIADKKINRDHPPIIAIKAAVAASKRLLLLQGPLGTGKSVAAATVIWDAIKGMFLPVSKYVQLVSSSDRSEQYRGSLALYADPLVLDDAGAEQTRDHWRVAELLNQRYDGDSVTIVTSNLKPEQWVKAYGPRLMSRFGEIGHPIACTQVIRPDALRQNRLF